MEGLNISRVLIISAVIAAVLGKEFKVIALEVNPIMIHHSHAMLTRPKVERLGKNRFKVSGMQFHMPVWWTT